MSKRFVVTMTVNYDPTPRDLTEAVEELLERQGVDVDISSRDLHIIGLEQSLENENFEHIGIVEASAEPA